MMTCQRLRVVVRTTNRSPANHPVSGFPLSGCLSLPGRRMVAKGRGTTTSCPRAWRSPAPTSAFTLRRTLRYNEGSTRCCPCQRGGAARGHAGMVTCGHGVPLIDSALDAVIDADLDSVLYSLRHPTPENLEVASLGVVGGVGVVAAGAGAIEDLEALLVAVRGLAHEVLEGLGGD